MAQAAETLIGELTNFVTYSSGKWQAGGKDETLGKLHLAVNRWQQARKAVEQEDTVQAAPAPSGEVNREAIDALNRMAGR